MFKLIISLAGTAVTDQTLGKGLFNACILIHMYKSNN